jgi:hypothetical protein
MSGARRVFIRRMSVRVTRLQIILLIKSSSQASDGIEDVDKQIERLVGLFCLDRIWRFAASIAGSRCRWGLQGLADGL